MKRLSLLGEFFEFLKERRKLWLLPLILLLVLFGMLLAFTETSALAPFIYQLF